MSAVEQAAPRGDDAAAPDQPDRTAELADAAPEVPPRRLGLLMVVGGALGLVAALVLSVERFRLAEDPSYVPSCSINPVLSCGSVMAQPQAAVLGFPNSLLGIAAFVVPLVLGTLLLSGTELPRWVRTGWVVGITAGLGAVLWLASQSLFVIGALCPYCMVVWAVVIPMFWTSVADALDRHGASGGAARAVVELRLLFVLATYAAFVLEIGVVFWSYWRTLLP